MDEQAEQGHGLVHTQSTIRLDTMQLTDILNTPGNDPDMALPPLSIGMTPTVGPSNLSKMLQRQGAPFQLRMPPTQPPPPPPPPRHTSSSDSVSTLHPAGSEEEELVTPVTTKNRGTVRIVTPTPPHDERTPLLAPQPPSTPPSSSSSWLHSKTSLARLVDSVRQHAPDVPSQTAQALPAVGLGALLNILDGVSYGMIMFPASGVFADKGSMGVSMFFVT